MTCFPIRNHWAALLLGCFVGVPFGLTAATSVTYNQDIRPILSDNCFACHGPDQARRKGKLRLDVREEALARKAFVPTQPDESELVRRIFSQDEDEVMPPPKSQKKLTTAQKELLRRWVAEGAEYQGHWAYLAPVKAKAPQGSEAIDFLVQQRLKQIGLAPSPEADRRTLARRLSFDLTGLPPQPEDVKQFEADQSPDAYARLVEKFLASPAYGERMALAWLDLVRYADTIGYHSDNPRNVWPYRDYVIQAFNNNKPFDQFTREQLAGDLLPGSGLEQKVASAFNRLLLTTEEGGAQPKDYEARMLTDRVRAVGTAWLGQTLGCCQCHDHKFDPATARDFYSMGAFFADLKEPIIGRREDGVLVPDKNQAVELAGLEREWQIRQKQFETSRPELLARWEAAAIKAMAAEPSWTVLKPEEVRSEGGTRLRADLDGRITVDKDPSGGSETYRIQVRPGLLGIVGFRLEALSSDRLPSHGPGRGKDGSFLLSEFRVEDADGHSVELAEASASFDSDGRQAAATIDGDESSDRGWAVRGLQGGSATICFATKEPIDAGLDAPLTLILKQNRGNNQILGHFRLSATTDPIAARAVQAAVPPSEIVNLLKVSDWARSAEEKSKLASYHRGIEPDLAGLRQRLAAAQKAKFDLEAAIPKCLVAVSLEAPRTVRVLPRGDWMIETGDIVEPALPAYLAKTAKKVEGRRSNRLDLANWLVDRNNPLTARVFVNRLWKQFFGIGLSKVLEDFGTQGEPPVNQPLLDWLACEFMESGWNVKHLVRLMVNSQTYRQTSIASKELQRRDPDNRELARQSRWRIEAELVRDNALAISGLLVRKVGGPSVRPYQPDGYWENLNFPVRGYDASPGEDQYRRGLYTWWQRSFLHPSLLAFDAPTREECAADRSRSNIPQQALVLLNDPTYVEAARAFAARILRQGGADPRTRFSWAWEQALSRPPRPDEVETVQQLLDKELAEFQQHEKNSAALLGVGQLPAPEGLNHAEWAAWTAVARVLLNLHETITRS